MSFVNKNIVSRSGYKWGCGNTQWALSQKFSSLKISRMDKGEGMMPYSTETPAVRLSLLGNIVQKLFYIVKFVICSRGQRSREKKCRYVPSRLYIYIYKCSRKDGNLMLSSCKKLTIYLLSGKLIF